MMNHRLLLLPLVILTLPVTARPWTNTEGKTIEADFVSADEQAVRLRVKGRVTSYPLEKLSQADRDWIAAQSADPGEEKKPANPVYASDMEAFIKEIDKTYPFFELKGIKDDWEKAKAGLLARGLRGRIRRRASSPWSTAPSAFLRDGHMRITESEDPARARRAGVLSRHQLHPRRRRHRDGALPAGRPAGQDYPSARWSPRSTAQDARKHLDARGRRGMEGRRLVLQPPAGPPLRLSDPAQGRGRRQTHDPLPGPGPREEVQAHLHP